MFTITFDPKFSPLLGEWTYTTEEARLMPTLEALSILGITVLSVTETNKETNT